MSHLFFMHMIINLSMFSHIFYLSQLSSLGFSIWIFFVYLINFCLCLILFAFKIVQVSSWIIHLFLFIFLLCVCVCNVHIWERWCHNMHGNVREPLRIRHLLLSLLDIYAMKSGSKAITFICWAIFLVPYYARIF